MAKNNTEERMDTDKEEETERVVGASESGTVEKEQGQSHEQSVSAKVPGNGPHRKAWAWLTGHKKLSIPAAVVAVLIILAAVPYTRYLLAGTVVRKDFVVAVTDSQSNSPVTSATITLEGKTATTDSKGRVTIHANVGHAKLAVSKKYYQTASVSVLVPIGAQKQPYMIRLVATGRQVPVVVKNKLTGKPVADATVTADNTQALTDANGRATIVLAANLKTVNATITAKNFNKGSATITVTASEDAGNAFTITPTGKIYFLSNASGKIDVVKTDLDGQNRQTMLAGTGTEDKGQTVLLASQDWKFLALDSKRDGGDNAKLFLIDTSNDSLTTMDEGDAQFSLVGWSGHTFVYTVSRNGKLAWNDKAQALKSFNADNKKLTVLDETHGYDGYVGENYTTAYIINNEVVYGKSLSGDGPSTIGHQATVNGVHPDGSSKHVIKSWDGDNTGYVGVTLAAGSADSVYFADTNTDGDHLYEYQNGQVTTESGKEAGDIYTLQYFTYLFSPSNQHTFWSEPRDGKNTLFIGDNKGENGKQVASLSDYQTYGWFTDDYVLLSKNGSELYIADADNGNIATPLKVADYYKPAVTFPGYGGGYGGI